MALTDPADKDIITADAQKTPVGRKWKKLRRSKKFRSFLLFLVFVVIATLFWIILALNDSIQAGFRVNVRLYNVPDSVTFIDDIPSSINVTVRDKGTHLLRSGLMKNPVLPINFKEYARSGAFRYTAADLYSELRSAFGSSAQIVSVSIDSIRSEYTDEPGRVVPVHIEQDINCGMGYTIAGNLRVSQAKVILYSVREDLDTIRYVKTRRIAFNDVTRTTRVQVGIEPIKNVKIVPDKIWVTIPVETLVKRTSQVPVRVSGVPDGESLLIFPANVEVSYFVPMSKFNEKVDDIEVRADYRDIASHRGARIPLRVTGTPRGCVNVQLVTDSVEYTIVR